MSILSETTTLNVMKDQLKLAIGRTAGILLLASILNAPVRADDPGTIDQPLPNGNFNDGLTEWTIELSDGVAVPAPTIDVVAGAARIQRGGAYVAGLSQDFIAPEGLLALKLRLTEMPVLTADGSFIPDAFDVHVSGSGGLTRSASIRPGATASANEAAVPAGFNLGAGATLVGDLLRIPVQGVSDGELLTLSVALVGAERDSASVVAFDDVVMEIQRKRPPPNPNRLNTCEFFRDRFDAIPLAPQIPSCWIRQINDTGQLACLGNGDGSCQVAGRPGQDAEFGRDALAAAGSLLKLGTGPAGFDYSKLDGVGNLLPDSADRWSCVVDNFTGLIWEVKVDDSASPRHFAHSYSWRQDDGTLNGGAPGLIDGGQCVGSLCDTASVVDAVNLEGLCGASDWRMPTRDELATLVHSGVDAPAIAIDYFPFGDGQWWTRTPSASSADAAWGIDFASGSVDMEMKSSALRVRLVREIK